MNELRIGWSEVDITPSKKVSLVGQFAERISEYVEKPITATALAISSGYEQVVFVSCDLVDISSALLEGVRKKLVGNSLGLEPMKVIISATHIHTGPGYTNRCSSSEVSDNTSNAFSELRKLLESELPAGKKYTESANITENNEIATDAELFSLLTNRISDCVFDAWRKRTCGSFSNAFGRAAVGMCRRAVYSDGSAQMWGDTNTAVFENLEGGNDSGIELLFMFDDKSALSGIVINLACPAQCVQHRLFVSPDFWGEVKKLLRERFGEHIFMLPLLSPAGDQCPVDLIRWVDPESDVHDPNLIRDNPPKRKADPSMFDIAGMKTVGRRIAREVIDVFETGLDEQKSEAELVHQVHNMQLPLRRTTLSEIAHAKREIREYLRDVEGDVDFNDLAHLMVHIGILKRAVLQEKMDILETEVHILKLGSIAFATNPFELFLDYGNQIRARSRAEQTFLIQLACGTEGYLPTAKAENGGHYSAFISSGMCGHIGGEQLVRETVKSINEMF